MSIDAIAAIAATGAASVADTPAASNVRLGGMDFSQAVGDGLASVNASMQQADQNLRALAAGQEVAPHEVMISMEEARMHLMLLSEVRNRVVEAYQELARMQL
jgi:flagellar hook-basal body complex protein FliE